VLRWDLTQPFHGIAHSGEIATIAGNRLWMDARINDAGIRDEGDLVKAGGSDAQTLDAAVQWLREIGLTTPHAIARLLPPAWEQDEDMEPDVRAFHRHESCFAEPWEGSAALAFADGRYVGAMVGKDGFSQLTTVETDDLVCVASDARAFDLPEATVIERGQLGRSQLLVVDLDDTTMLRDGAVWRTLAAQKPYAALANRRIHRVRETMTLSAGRNDARAQVSLRTLLGRRGQWTSDGLPPVLLELDSPVLIDPELEPVLAQTAVRAAVLPIGFNANDALGKAVTNLQTTAAALAANGTRILVLSDRGMEPGFSPIPSLVATVAVDTALRSARLRLRASIIVESRDIRDAHDAAALCSAGASALVALEPCRDALESGLRTIMSDAGVRSFEAYCGARLNHAVAPDLSLPLDGPVDAPGLALAELS
jgi:hypothetical protein